MQWFCSLLIDDSNIRYKFCIIIVDNFVVEDCFCRACLSECMMSKNSLFGICWNLAGSLSLSYYLFHADHSTSLPSCTFCCKPWCGWCASYSLCISECNFVVNCFCCACEAGAAMFGNSSHVRAYQLPYSGHDDGGESTGQFCVFHCCLLSCKTVSQITYTVLV